VTRRLITAGSVHRLYDVPVAGPTSPDEMSNPAEDAQMLTVAPETATGELPDVRDEPGTRARRWLDRLAPVVYLIGGVYLVGRLWLDPNQRLQADNIQDQGFFQFVLAHAARSVTHLTNPLFEGQINIPHGVNMMANTSVLGLAIPLSPITLAFGPGVAFAVLVALAPTLTATAWYYVLSRYVVRSRVAALVAAGFCGFGPGFVSQSNGHPNVAAQFMVPLILLQLARLRDSRHPVRGGLVLGLLITYQAFINEETLLFTAVAGGLLVLTFALSRPEQWRATVRPGLIGLASAAGIAAVLLAYPLWFQFFGPQHYKAVPALSVSYYSDLGSYFNYPNRSLAGAPSGGFGMRSHLAEQNAYYGWPLLILAVVIAVWLWRNLLVRVAAIVAAFFAAMSLGPQIVVYGHKTHIPGPFRLFNWLPVIESVVPVRVGLMVIPALGVLIAIGLDHVIRAPRRAGAPRLLWYAVFVAALLPLFPLPLRTMQGPPNPGFVTAGTWRQYVAPGHSVVFVPLPNIGNLEGQRWTAQVRLDMPIAGGYFLGPDVGTNKRALYGQPIRPTAQILDDMARFGRPKTITEVDRQHMIEDLRVWRAAVVVIGQVPHADLLRQTVTELLGDQPQFIGGAWVWDVRARVDG
jgi:hypothetical protein